MWNPGDNPEDHPLWNDQVDLEMHMMNEGANLVRERADKARQKGQMTRLHPYRSLVEEWIPVMAEGIRDLLRDVGLHCRHVGGALPVSARFIAQADPYVASYITLRSVLNAMSTGHTGIMGVAKEIGLRLEHEARMKAWEKRDPKLFHQDQRSLKLNRSTAVHRRRVNIYRFNKLMREPLEWQDWTDYERTRVGLDLIDILVRYTQQFDTGPDPYHVPRRGKRVKPQIVLRAKPELLEWLTEAVDRAEVMSPVYTPTLMPPKRWEGMRVGAYYTEYVRVPTLIRFKVHQEEQRGTALSEYDALDMEIPYAALHAIQEVPWRVNERVLDVAAVVWKRDLAIANLPPREKEPLPPPIPGMEDDEALLREWKREAAPVYGRNARRISWVLTTDRTLSVAERYRSLTFYFPHMLDFRGRMYPIPQDLQPQGRDLARGLLIFAEGKPVEGSAVGWLAVHLANCWGYDKVSFDERIAWVEEREKLWRRIAKDPIKNRQWAATSGPDKVSSPWQTLAAIFEWVRYLDEGEGMVSHLPIRVDGTCNGIQHLSAMVRDGVGGAAVNLVPGDRPRDIYKEVAEAMTERFRGIAEAGGEEGSKAEWWLDLTGGDLPRSLTKRPVMIMPYGGTREAYFEYTREWLVEEHGEALEGVDPRGVGSNLAFCVKHMWDIVTTTVRGGVKTMEWLQDCARLAARGDQPIFWQTPAGFIVRHFYGKLEMRQIKTMIDGQVFRIVDYRVTKKLDVRNQLKGIAPNFVHSLDASALMTAITMAWEAGINSLTTIHDAYGTLAADMWTLHAILREAFVETHRADVLGHFRNACKVVLADHIMAVERLEQDDYWLAVERAEKLLPQPLEHGELDLEAITESDYFFA